MPKHRDKQPVRIFGIDIDMRDHLRFAQSQMTPRLSGIGGFVHAVADREIGANDPGAGPDIDHIGIGGRHRNGADGAGGRVVKNRTPIRTVVRGAPHAAIVEADVKHVRLGGHTRQRARAPGAHGTDLSPVHGRKQIGRLGDTRRGGRSSEQREEQRQWRATNDRGRHETAPERGRIP
jgi:hypothetical protein